MPNINFAESSEVSALGIEIMEAEYPQLIEHGVDIRFRLSKKTPNLESDNYWGETRLFNNQAAWEAQLDGAKAAKLNPPTFVCIDCMKWKPEKQLRPITLGADKRFFCIDCTDKLSDAQRDTPDEKFLASMTKRQVRVDAKEQAGPPEYDSFFGIYMYKSVWDEVSNSERLPMLSTQLARCGSSRDEETGELKLKIIKPPVKLFPGVVERHGTQWWKRLDDVARTIKAQGQLTLIDTADEATGQTKKRGRRAG
jgi:hypothetical protein